MEIFIFVTKYLPVSDNASNSKSGKLTPADDDSLKTDTFRIINKTTHSNISEPEN